MGNLTLVSFDKVDIKERPIISLKLNSILWKE